MRKGLKGAPASRQLCDGENGADKHMGLAVRWLVAGGFARRRTPS